MRLSSFVLVQHASMSSQLTHLKPWAEITYTAGFWITSVALGAFLLGKWSSNGPTPSPVRSEKSEYDGACGESPCSVPLPPDVLECTPLMHLFMCYRDTEYSFSEQGAGRKRSGYE